MSAPPSRPKKIVIATKNRGKADEIRALLDGLGLEVFTLEDFPHIHLPPETGSTFRENAVIKARFVADSTGLPAIADDSGLEVDALDGRPGVYSARYAGEGATDAENFARLLKELEGVPSSKRGARFRCVVAYSEPNGTQEVFEGVFEGAIAEGPRGTNGFGYDPVFLIPDMGKTSAELTPAEKNEISHRGKALKRLKERFFKARQ